MSETNIQAVHDRLVSSGAFVPVEQGGLDERSWLDCDLASLAENRLGELVDPRDLDPERRADWLSRVTDEPQRSLASRGRYERFYWLMEDGDRAGTVALANQTLGNGTLYLSSFYLRPPYRHRGAGKRALARVKEALASHGLGMRLDTSWCWQQAVRFYLSSGIWLYMWKRDLTLFWGATTPPHHITVGETEAKLEVQKGTGTLVLARATRQGDSLTFFEDERRQYGNDSSLGEAPWLAATTLALALALQGWPLVRSQKDWDKNHYADGGPPEALAYKIQIWEAWAKSRGWTANTPRIPNLDYHSWDELQTRWAAENEAYEAELAARKQKAEPGG